MNIIAFLIGGLFTYWFYWSIKSEGIYWLSKIFLLAGSFFLLFISLVSYQLELNRLLNLFLGDTNHLVRVIFFICYLMLAYLIQKHILSPIIFAIDKKIEKRIGKNPYL